MTCCTTPLLIGWPVIDVNLDCPCIDVMLVFVTDDIGLVTTGMATGGVARIVPVQTTGV